MAEQREVVIFQVKLDNDQFNAQAAKTRQEIQRLKAEQKELDTTNDSGAEAYQRLEVQIKANQKEYRELTKIQTDLLKVEKDGITSQRGLQAAYDAAQLKLKKLQGTLKQNADGTFELTEEYKAQAKEVEKANAALKAFDAGLGQNQRNVGNYENSVEGVRAEIQRLREAMMKLDLNSQEFKDTKDAADNLQLSLDQALGKVNEFGEREPKNQVKKAMDDAFESAAALGSAIGLLSTLTGDNEDAQEKLAKAMQAVAIAQAAANLIKAKGAIIDTLSIAKTKALSIAQQGYNFVMEQGTVVAKLFRASLIAIPFVAIGAAITALIQKLRSQKEATEDQTQAQEELNKSISTTTEAYNELAEQITGPEGVYLEQIKATERLIKLRTAQGASDRELLNLQKQLLQIQLQQNETLYDAALANELLNLYETTKLRQEELDIKTDLQIIDFKLSQLRDREIEQAERLNARLRDQLQLREGNTDARRTELDVVQRDISLFLLKQGEDIEARFEALANISQDAAVSIGNIFAESLTEAGFQTEDFFRRLAALTLDILQRQLLTAIAEIYFKSVAENGFAGLIKGAALTAVITGLTETAKAALTKPVKFAMGGEYDPFGVDVGGKSHAAGGTKYYGEDGNVIELEHGEKMFVANKRTSGFIRELAKLNQSFGGRGLNGASAFLQSGGFAVQSVANNVNTQIQSERVFADVLRNLPESVVSVSEINKVQRSVRVAHLNNSL